MHIKGERGEVKNSFRWNVLPHTWSWRNWLSRFVSTRNYITFRRILIRTKHLSSTFQIENDKVAAISSSFLLARVRCRWVGYLLRCGAVSPNITMRRNGLGGFFVWNGDKKKWKTGEKWHANVEQFNNQHHSSADFINFMLAPMNWPDKKPIKAFVDTKSTGTLAAILMYAFDDDDTNILVIYLDGNTSWDISLHTPNASSIKCPRTWTRRLYLHMCDVLSSAKRDISQTNSCNLHDVRQKDCVKSIQNQCNRMIMIRNEATGLRIANRKWAKLSFILVNSDWHCLLL